MTAMIHNVNVLLWRCTCRIVQVSMSFLYFFFKFYCILEILIILKYVKHSFAWHHLNVLQRALIIKHRDLSKSCDSCAARSRNCPPGGGGEAKVYQRGLGVRDLLSVISLYRNLTNTSFSGRSGSHSPSRSAHDVRYSLAGLNNRTKWCMAVS